MKVTENLKCKTIHAGGTTPVVSHFLDSHYTFLYLKKIVQDVLCMSCSPGSGKTCLANHSYAGGGGEVVPFWDTVMVQKEAADWDRDRTLLMYANGDHWGGLSKVRIPYAQVFEKKVHVETSQFIYIPCRKRDGVLTASLVS